jgi:hypothetical protein
MTEIERLIDQLKKDHFGQPWHGPSVAEILDDVTAHEAAARPVPGAHTIWELVHHMRAWRVAVRNRLEGSDRADYSPEQDWPPVHSMDEAAWRAAVDALIVSHEALIGRVSELAESRLDEPIMEGMSSVHNHIAGLLQHDAYHAGQIVILRKALQSG